MKRFRLRAGRGICWVLVVLLVFCSIPAQAAKSPYIGVIHIEGTIEDSTSNYEYDHSGTLEAIEKLVDDEDNKALLLYLNSPGGAIYESDELYNAVLSYKQRTDRPVVATHSNSRAVFPHPRNLTDEQFTAIINTNGVAGLNMYAGFLGDDPDFDTVVSHLEHFLALGGENNVSMGGDWDGITSMPRGMNGIQDMEKLYEHLLRRNYSETLLKKVFYSNLMRVVNEVCSM